MEVVLCKLTLETIDKELEHHIRTVLPAAKVVLAKCIGCCGDCTTSYVALKDGQLLSGTTRDELVCALKA